ncbi:hypothetical protein Harman_42060 [Haloarcula mannanilytica]|uniref:TraD/TraG TraM recognition site domain-containing protein n=1 Tax=Haloarcula mannanilytica TaxID=2509225 RepID=A0A4C2EP11_9EURY|nr:hypothetical protein Harman_42060 [Haloarcula mannanilytica]
MVDVREGEVGYTVTRLLSSIVITKLWAAAQNRYYQDSEIDQPFTLFVDELQSYPGEGPQFAEILSKAREYRLGCWLVTQYLSQLPSGMRNAVKTNCRTKLVFDPTGSDDIPKLAKMLRGTDRRQLESLGDYRAIVQAPATRKRNKAVTVDTYPPWNTDEFDLDRIKTDATPATETDLSLQKQVTGKGVNAGGEKHTKLLSKAEKRLEDLGLQVRTLYQDPGDEKPDGHVKKPDGSLAHLEAEHTTLTKPAKVLKNLQRAKQQGRECIFVVEEGNAAKLDSILSDPVNRQGNQHRDEHGSYSYYTGDDGEFKQIELLQNAEYRIIEVTDDKPEVHDEEVEPECPELEAHSEEELEAFCLYREDGYCTELETGCPVISDD